MKTLNSLGEAGTLVVPIMKNVQYFKECINSLRDSQGINPLHYVEVYYFCDDLQKRFDIESNFSEIAKQCKIDNLIFEENVFGERFDWFTAKIVKTGKYKSD